MMSGCKIILLASALVFAVTTPWSRIYAGDNELRIKGFGTVGATLSDNQSGYAYDIKNKPNYYHDTKFGLNFSSPLGEHWSWAAQTIVKRWVTETFDDSKVKLDWLLVNYQPFANLKFRVGKQKVPLWLFSDYVDVPFLYHWVRPVEEVYGISPLNNVIGVSANGVVHLGAITLEADAVVGDNKIESEFSGSTVFYGDVNRLQLLALTLGHENIRVKGSIAKSDDVRLNFRFPGMATTYPPLKYSFSSLGLNANYEGHFFWTEFASMLVDNYSNRRGFYVSYGKKMGRFSPHLTYAVNLSRYYRLVDADVTIPLDGGVTVRKVYYVPERTTRQQSLTLGMVAEITSTSNVKLEWKKIRVDGDAKRLVQTSMSAGGVTTTTTESTADLERGLFDAEPKGDVHVFSATVNFIF